MSARILIVDGIATNRIVLKVMMQAAQFHVTVCATRAEAERFIRRQPPDLLLINLADATGRLHGLCRDLRNDPATQGTAIIAVGVADTAQARFAALDAGADDVLPHPLNDVLLLARIRCLLRMRSAGQELSLRDSTSRALGFEDQRHGFARAARIVHLTMTGDHPPLDAVTQLAAKLGRGRFSMAGSIDLDADIRPPDLVILDARHAHGEPFGTIAELRVRTATRLAAILVVLPDDTPAQAAMCLDLGADDVIDARISAPELDLRAKALIARKQLQDSLRASLRKGLDAAVTDPLTGLFNRRYITPHLTRMAQEALRTDRHFAVMMLDIDHFKVINDRYGHAAGDRVLVALALRLRENLRAIDLVGRMGGEEFLIAMPRTSDRQARLAADRLRRLIANTPFDIGPKVAPISVSVSIGIAVSAGVMAEAKPLAKLCDHADRALYAAKTAGRNQVAVASSAA